MTGISKDFSIDSVTGILIDFPIEILIICAAPKSDRIFNTNYLFYFDPSNLYLASPCETY